MSNPAFVKNVREMLEDLELEHLQKHPSFHVLKIEDHENEISKYSNFTSTGIFELSYSANYELEKSIDNQSFQVKDRNIAFLAPGQSFYINIDENYTPKNGLAYLLFFTADFLRLGPTDYSVIKRFPYFNKHYSPVYYIDEQKEAIYLAIMEKIYQEFQCLCEENIEIIRSYLVILLFELKRDVLENVHYENTVSRAEEITYRFENLLKNSKEKRQKVGFYAEQLNVSTVYLADCVRKVTKSTPKKIISDYVLMEANSLLQNSVLTVQQVALTLGFEDAANFINFYKKNTGVTPSAYRNG